MITGSRKLLKVKLVKKYEKSIAFTHPDIAKQWHPTMNGNLTTDQVSYGSRYKAWWKCHLGDDHIWKMSVKTRTILNGRCSVCTGHKVSHSNCLAHLFPEIASRWHPTKNGDTTPNDVTAFSHHKAWWICGLHTDHIYLSPVSKQSAGRECPICAGKQVIHSTCVAVCRPDIAIQWHPTRNGMLTPYDFTPGSHKKIWWVCPLNPDHEWLSSIKDRTLSGRGCAVCSGKQVILSTSLFSTHPDIADEWHLTRNGELDPTMVTYGSDRPVWWQCRTINTHEWQCAVSSRTISNSGCPVCNVRSSKGETYVDEVLKNIKVRYERQYRIEECRNKLPLPFDFVIFKQDDIYLIEYQGEQHYVDAAGFFQGEEGLCNRKIRDQIKRNFCQDNGLKLLEIPYWDYDRIPELVKIFLCDTRPELKNADSGRVR